MDCTAQRLNYRDTLAFSKLALDYLDNAEALQPFYGFRPDKEGLLQQIKLRQLFIVNRPPRMNRVIGLLESVQRFLPEFKIPLPSEKQIWYGYRPCSPDGLPYIGKAGENLIVATGHVMIGLSLGAGTGKLVSELANEQATSVDMVPYQPLRFS